VPSRQITVRPTRAYRKRAVVRPAEAPDLTQPLAAIDAPVRRAREGIWLANADSIDVLTALARAYPEGLFDVVFADPPYFLSNDGITCHSGRMVQVNKGEWDRSRGVEDNHLFHQAWIGLCQRLLRPHGTLWVSGTHHVILSAGFAMQQLGMKILNAITWEKPNPPPNLSCRYFTHSTETLLWAAKSPQSKHLFNYQLMRARAGGRQMKSVWRLLAPHKAEKAHGKHPTQKPEALVRQCLEAASIPGALVLDPFLGSGTTAVAAVQTGRRCLGIDNDPAFLKVAEARVRAATRME
jgi:site-specific DNA-methyltransferase (adenine-specific)